MAKFKIRHIGWFFNFLWICLLDLFSGPIESFKYGLFKENWVDLQTKIHIDTDPKMITLMKDFKNYIKEEK